MNRDNLNRFNDMVAEAVETINDVSFEIDVDGEWVEITEIPATMEQDEYQDWLEPDWAAIDQFPELAEELERTLDLNARRRAADHAVRRAESGYAQ